MSAFEMDADMPSPTEVACARLARNPGWMPAADHHDPQRAAAVRKTLLDKLATDRQRVIGFHLPFPGTGFVERGGSSYRFVPA